MQRQTTTYFRALHIFLVLFLSASTAWPLAAQNVENSRSYFMQGSTEFFGGSHDNQALTSLDLPLLDGFSFLNNDLSANLSSETANLQDMQLASAISDVIERQTLQSDCGFQFDNSLSSLELGVEGLRRSLPQTRSVADTNTKVSQLRYIYNNRYQLKLTISLTEDQTVDIGLYNILGKRVKDLEHGFMSECEDKELKYSISDVPPGVYIVAAQGSNFRSALRVAISRGDE